jgi:TetR/AcrR family transcriptional regulator, acrAB operon repressor
MARKTKEETQATRDGILDAAEACFHELGVAGTTLEKIGARAGFSRGAVYWHFKNKAEVLAAVMQRCRVPFMQKLELASSSSRDTPVLDLRCVLYNAWRELEDSNRLRGLLEIMLRNDLSNESQSLRDAHVDGFRDTHALMTSVFERAASLDQLRPGIDPELAARMLHITMSGVLYTAIFHPGSVGMTRDGLIALDTTLAALVRESHFRPGQIPPAPTGYPRAAEL